MCNKQPTLKKSPGLFFLTQMLRWAFWVIYLSYFSSVWVVCVHFILFIKLFLCRISFKCMQSNIQAQGVNQTNVAGVESVLLLDEESDALLKINDVFIKIQNTNTLDVKTCPQSCLLFVVEQVMKVITVHFVHEWSAGRGSYPWSVPVEHDSSSVREPEPLRWKHSYRVVHLLVNYIGLMFNIYF